MYLDACCKGCRTRSAWECPICGSKDFYASASSPVGSTAIEGETMKHECDCGARYNTTDALYACQNANHYQLPATCSWVEDEEGIWFTGCGNASTFNDGGPSENGAKFCMYCGDRLIATRHEQL